MSLCANHILWRWGCFAEWAGEYKWKNIFSTTRHEPWITSIRQLLTLIISENVCRLLDAPSIHKQVNLTKDPPCFSHSVEAIGGWVLFTLLDSFFHCVVQTHTSVLNVLWEDWEHTPTEQLSIWKITWVCPYYSRRQDFLLGLWPYSGFSTEWFTPSISYKRYHFTSGDKNLACLLLIMSASLQKTTQSEYNFVSHSDLHLPLAPILHPSTILCILDLVDKSGNVKYLIFKQQQHCSSKKESVSYCPVFYKWNRTFYSKYFTAKVK